MRSLLPLLLLGCQPPPGEAGPETTCDPAQPEPGQLRSQLWCSDLEMTDGEATSGDWWLGNHELRLAIRHPLSSVTQPGTGGGTLVDVAPWGYRDRLHEMVPLVGDGWLAIDEWSVQEAQVTLSGIVVPLPDRPATTPGARRSVRWRLAADSAWIELEGADGLLVHPHGDFELLQGQLVHDALTLGHDGQVEEDLGGSLRLSGVQRVLVAPTQSATEWLYPEGQPVSGQTSPEAERVLALAGEEVLARIGVDSEGSFSGRVPAAVDGLRAEGWPYAPSPTAAPGQGVELPLGESSRLELIVHHQGADPRPVRVGWEGGFDTLPAGGGSLELPPGAHELEISSGPLTLPWTGRVELIAGETSSRVVELEGASAGDHLLVRLTQPVSRSRSWRGGSDEDALHAAHAEGVELAIATPEDEVPAASPAPEHRPWLRVRNGNLFTHPDGWTIASWPWSVDADEGGHGALAPYLVQDAETALHATWGGESLNRFVAVDLAFLEAVGPPWQVHPDPDLIRLEPPGAAGPPAWSRWFEWLDAQVDVVPVGPLTWVEVPDADLATASDAEQALVRGRTVATTGPWLRLVVDGSPPGELRDDLGATVPVEVELRDPRGLLDTLALIGPGGQLLHEQPAAAGALSTRVELDRWLLAAAWSADGHDFALSAPVWSQEPSVHTGDSVALDSGVR